jgi:hypothetical protein
MKSCKITIKVVILQLRNKKRKGFGQNPILILDISTYQHLIITTDIFIVLRTKIKNEPFFIAITILSYEALYEGDNESVNNLKCFLRGHFFYLEVGVYVNELG